MATHGKEGRMPQLKTEYVYEVWYYVWVEPNKPQWSCDPGDTWLRADGVLMRYGGPSFGWQRVPGCECGGEKTRTTHSHWCPRYLK